MDFRQPHIFASLFMKTLTKIFFIFLVVNSLGCRKDPEIIDINKQQEPPPVTPIATEIFIYPNPFVDSCTIQSNKPMKDITITDITGKVVGQFMPYPPVNAFGMKPNLPNGLYFLKIAVDTQYVWKRVIVAK